MSPSIVWSGAFACGLAIISSLTLLLARLCYNLYFSQLAKFRGPWYAIFSSLTSATLCLLHIEPQWLLSTVRRYGVDEPIRIAPNVLLFPKPSSLKEIYWDAKLNQRSALYGTGALGPPSLFSTLDPKAHRVLRKALAGPAWNIGPLKHDWEHRISDHIQLFCKKMAVRAKADGPVCISDRFAEFTADIMTMVSFSEPWGFVENGRDERHLIKNFRQGLHFFGFSGRFVLLRDYLLKLSFVRSLLLPKMSDTTGIGYLVYEADTQITNREKQKENFNIDGQRDFLQHCLEARIDGQPLSRVQRLAHVTLLTQAGADTTGTTLGSTLRCLLLNPEKMRKAQEEVAAADAAHELSQVIQYDEARAHLPFVSACINETLRLYPSAPNLFPRVVGAKGAVVDGHYIPAGTEITSNAWVVQRDPKLYAPDPESFRPERWLESAEKVREMENASFTFGIGPRVCLGKDVALLELWKLVPEMIRRFDFELVDPGKFVVTGGVACIRGLMVKLFIRGKGEIMA